MRELRHIAAAAALCAWVGQAGAQAWPQHSLWFQSPARVNPAASANLFSLDGIASYRRQWNNLEGAPQTTYVNVAAPVYIAGAGASLGFERDEAGLQVANLFRASGSYRAYARGEIAVSVGAGISFRQTELDGAELRTDDGEYSLGSVVHRDPLLADAAVASSSVGVDVGAELAWRESRFGVSVLDVNEPVSEYEGAGRRWPRTVVVYAHGLLPVAESIDLEVAATAYTDQRLAQVQLSTLAWYASNIGVGAAFRGYGANSVDAASVLLAWRPSEAVTIAYAYDIGLSELRDAHDGSHEVSFRYVMTTPIGKGKLPPVIFNPRL